MAQTRYTMLRKIGQAAAENMVKLRIRPQLNVRVYTHVDEAHRLATDDFQMGLWLLHVELKAGTEWFPAMLSTRGHLVGYYSHMTLTTSATREKREVQSLAILTSERITALSEAEFSGLVNALSEMAQRRGRAA